MSKLRDILLIAKDLSQISADIFRCQIEQAIRIYRKMLVKILEWLLVALTAIMLGIGGIGLLLMGAYFQLSVVMGSAGAAYLLGGFLILLAIIIFLLGRSIIKEQNER